jgi:predicted  nucleic acid-binding Zn-ribbon protein
MLAGLALPLLGCQKAYYGTMEAFGQHKRDLLVSRVEDASKAQDEAKEEFASALEEFSALVNFDGGDLKKAYDKSKSALDDCESKADKVHDRIESIESVGTALFAEWSKELSQYSDASLRSKSESQMNATKSKYNDMLGAMKRASATMNPVLSKFRDNVLFLKHNLNAQAVSSLKGEVTKLETDVGDLVRQMEASIAEADTFIKNMKSAD